MVSSLSSSSGASFTTSNNTPLPTRQQANSNTSANMILQRRTDPLTYGGSDALWDAIAKSKGSDAVIEKIISNFIRRGGSPNTAKQSSTTLPIKYGYGMIHAVIVNKASNALDLLLQNGANPNIMSMCQLETDKVSPCYLACSVGWLAGLEKLVEVGGDLLFSRGEGNKKKTCLHVAAEYGYAEITEYLVNMTQGVLNLQTDNEGANILHYACLSGHTEIVGFIIRVCGVSPHDSDNKGELPIHWATRKGHVEVVLSLVERFNSDINSYISKKVPTPYDLAKSNGHKRLAELIKSRGGLAAKKLDKRREDEMANQVPSHLEAALSKNGLLGGF
ncbi:ankyrin repeat-containing domain protein [Pilobolus umbonatus]|nr:ankyrin repeat-containing domain protein [Pilobolus umbonatus]